MPNFYKFVNC